MILSKKVILHLFSFVFVLFVFHFGIFVSSIQAATYYINSSTGDDTVGVGSSASPFKTFHKGYATATNGDTIHATGTFTWTDADETGDATTTGYSISKNITITGASPATAIFQSDTTHDTADRRVFTVVSASGRTVTFDKVTIRNGKATEGAGIMAPTNSVSTIYVNNSVIEYNYASGHAGQGNGAGILALIHSSAGSLNVDNTTFQYNSITSTGNSFGGGIYASGRAYITNSTFNNNYAKTSGSAIAAYNVIMEVTNNTLAYNSAALSTIYVTSASSLPLGLRLTNNTIAHNTNTGNYGGAVYNSFSNLFIKNNLISQNIKVGLTHNDFFMNGGTLNNNGGNIIGVQTESFTQVPNSNGNILGYQANLNLGTSLNDNGTLNNTKTLALEEGSVAINVGTTGTNDSVSVPETDQRGLNRVGRLDIGAYEYGASANAIPIIGFTADNTLPTPVQASDGSGNVTISYKVQDPLEEPITTKDWQYSDDGGSSWNNLAASDLTGEDGSKSSGVGWSGTTHTMIWASKNQINNTDQSDLRFRFKVNDGTSDSAYGTTADFTVDNANPTVSTYSPADNATNVATNTNLTLTFDEDVDVETGDIVIYKASDSSVVETIALPSGKVTGTGTTIITINPDATLLDDTEYYVQIATTAFDDSFTNSYAGISNTTTWSFTTGDFTNPTISSINASTTSSSATITWNTDEATSSLVAYGLTSSLGITTPVTDTSPRVTSHSVAISGLKACARYFYTVTSQDASTRNSTSAIQTTSTTGCDTSSIQSGEEALIDESTGGTITLVNGTNTAMLQIPSNFGNNDATFQLNKLNSGSVATPPTGSVLAGDNIYDLIAIDENDNILTSFDESITFTITYGSSVENNFTETTLDVYRYTSSEWVDQNCTLDTSANTLTCTLDGFSTYGIFGTEKPSSSGGSSGGGPLASNTPDNICRNQSPTEIPDLFQINTTNKTATVFFTPIKYDGKYYISYSTNNSAEEHGAEVQLTTDGVQQFTVEQLVPNTTYYLKVRGQNGCMPGNWSNIMEFKTQTNAQQKIFYKNLISKMTSLVRGNNIVLSAQNETKKKTQTKKSNTCIYTVKAGDSLWSIAEKEFGSGTRYTEIMNANNLSSQLINPGKTLELGCK